MESISKNLLKMVESLNNDSCLTNNVTIINNNSYNTDDRINISTNNSIDFIENMKNINNNLEKIIILLDQNNNNNNTNNTNTSEYKDNNNTSEYKDNNNTSEYKDEYEDKYENNSISSQIVEETKLVKLINLMKQHKDEYNKAIKLYHEYTEYNNKLDELDKLDVYIIDKIIYECEKFKLVDYNQNNIILGLLKKCYSESYSIKNFIKINNYVAKNDWTKIINLLYINIEEFKKYVKISRRYFYGLE